MAAISSRRPFQTVSRFPSTDANLSRAVEEFERNVAKKFRDTEAQTASGGDGFTVITTVENIVAPANCAVRVGEATNSVVVSLPPNPTNGDFVWISVSNVFDFAVGVNGNGRGIDNGIETSGLALQLFEGESRLYIYIALDQVWRIYQKSIPQQLHTIRTHAADANTVALWQGDPPGNGQSGLIDSSGNSLTLEYSAGGPGKYGEIGLGQEGFFCDGTNYWRRAGNVNDPILNITGSMSIGCIALPTKFTALPMTIMSYGNNLGANTNNDFLYNINIKDTASTGIAVENCALLGHFYQTGAAIGHTNTDLKAWPFGRPVHLYWVYDSVAATLTPYINGFRQTIQTGLTAKAVGGVPAQRITIGIDSGLAFPFVGMVASIKVSNVARSDAYVRREACRCLGIGERGTV